MKCVLQWVFSSLGICSESSNKFMVPKQISFQQKLLNTKLNLLKRKRTETKTQWEKQCEAQVFQEYLANNKALML